jgi:hypothetical protein
MKAARQHEIPLDNNGTTSANLRNWMGKHGITRLKQDRVRAA